MEKSSEKERILKATRENKTVTYKGDPQGYQCIFQQELCRPQGNGMYIPSTEWEKPAAKNNISSKSISMNRRRHKVFPRQTKAKRVHDP